MVQETRQPLALPSYITVCLSETHGASGCWGGAAVHTDSPGVLLYTTVSLDELSHFFIKSVMHAELPADS